MTLSAKQASNLRILCQATDGKEVLIRASNADDAQTIVDVYPQVSRRSLYMRFLRAIDQPTIKQVRRFTDVDFSVHLSFVVIYDGEFAGAGRIIRTKPSDTTGELSCMMIDKFQRKGLGRLLVAELIEQGREWGLSQIIALVHPQNGPMLRLFKSLGYPCDIVWEEGDYLVNIDNSNKPDFDLNPPPMALCKSA